MLHAIVDLGSNTMRLCIYEKNDNGLKSIYEKKTMAGLVNYIKNERLSTAGINRTCAILEEYKLYTANFGISEKELNVFATASLRNIVNTKEVIDKIKEATGLTVELLSGEEEATLDFMGAIKVFQGDSGILVDIGGGSTELVSFKDRQIQYATSMPVGSLNLYVNYVKKIIPKEDERELIKEHVTEALKSLELKKETLLCICGVGGTMRAAAKLSNQIFGYSKENITVKTSDIKEILHMIHNSKKQTIAPVLQVIPDRIHTIIPGLIAVDTIADFYEAEQIVVSKYGVREGYLYERITKENVYAPSGK
ncbi:Ppx/GppA phosphatase family protein [Anaerocolumna xylanovorans]|uniref:Exopolyphosphatase / guanosine-5'-triphosphate,3'-diphosphate pyrophosphatase n=1 Tax=Anaerocolumna xylanovorans DSM 12503 TaxID=1121345 RepID=A0A1M7YDY9_9FIRM|nr:hypothetical protein [Anaerocolumna xylanovorans]SHO50796.1 exopolyphosphatase / guanosine-5'-triphosphate,3'-diphosphate pyrophosphatase [Anaerocolumna xylanovorans DSM 12503]